MAPVRNLFALTIIGLLVLMLSSYGASYVYHVKRGLHDAGTP